MRATLRLTGACNNRCVFCAQRRPDDASGADANAAGRDAGGTPDPVGEGDGDLPLGERLRRLRASSDGVSFVGGEPALDPGLAAAVAAARAAGFVAVGLQTNGLGLSESAPALAAAGLTDVHVSWHGASAAEHDYHTGVAGSFARLVAGVAAARAAGLPVVATTVVTRSNLRTLTPLAALLHQRGVAAWTLALPKVAGAAATHFDRVVPRLALALPFALHALDAARTLGLDAFVDGAPGCLLGPFAARALDGPPRAFAPVCDGCPARARCAGVDAHYLARFGADELRPRAAFVPAARTGLAAAFVGPGPLAAVAGPAWTPPSQARRSLVVLDNKAQPAAHEATAATPRRSGAALRELFPGLFDEGDAKGES